MVAQLHLLKILYFLRLLSCNSGAKKTCEKNIFTALLKGSQHPKL